MKTYVITDIHGCNQTFLALLEQINLSKSDELILLGDYIDRGPDSKGVLDTILRLKKQQYNLTCLMGNHESVVLKAFVDPESKKAKRWVSDHGGDKTLQSFNVAHIRQIPTKYFELLRSFPYYYEKENYIFVHAGLNLQAPNPLVDQKAMIWTKRKHQLINKRWLRNRIVIHGHSPQSKKDIKTDLKLLKERPFLGLDNGCAYPVGDLGQLCALELESKSLFFQANID